MILLKNHLKNELNIRTQKDFPVEGIEFIDMTPLTMQKDLFQEITNAFVEELKEKNIDYIVTPEARGFLFATPVANALNIGLIPVRKKSKLPPIAIQKEFDYEKEYGKDTLVLPKLINDDYQGKNFYLLDDIYATGNTFTAIKEAIISLGGNVIGEGVVLNIKELNQNQELFSLIDIHEE